MPPADDDSPDRTTPPPLTALFWIRFDLKVGYEIAWKRCSPDVELDGSVEFKSLPSGLHAIKEDLVYFVQDQYAGLSAFVNGPAPESQRNANLIAVGILVPLSNARLGRAWLHAQRLQELAQTLADDSSRTTDLEEYWASHKLKEQDESTQQPTKPNEVKAGRQRGLSNLTNVLPADQTLPSLHPALSMVDCIDTFGPLIYPLYKAALLRRRILFVAGPPVRRNCDFVFDFSLLSSIPAAVLDLLPSDAEKFRRIRPLFSVGVHDIPLLEKEAKAYQQASEPLEERSSDGYGPFGFLACTTDEVLSMKEKLYDLVVEMPEFREEQDGKERQWPMIKTTQGTEIKATQRDLRRWKLLRHELQLLQTIQEEVFHDEDSDTETEDEEGNFGPDTQRLLHERHQRERAEKRPSPEEDLSYPEKQIEPTTWGQLTYTGFLWWASAGERDAAAAEEEDEDRQLLGDLSDFLPPQASRNGRPAASRNQMSASTVIDTSSAGIHTAMIAYFHRLTSKIITTMAELVDTVDDEANDDDEYDTGAINVGSEDIRRMGLDTWSASDVEFVQDMMRMYLGRDAQVHSRSVECCGLKIY